MAETNYQGSCHCGAVRYQVALDLTQPAITCNCSICSRGGTMLSFVPTDKFTLQQGDDKLTSYRFNKKAIDHLFCGTCGIKSFARGETPDGKQMIAINVRCLEGVDLAQVPTHAVEGKNF